MIFGKPRILIVEDTAVQAMVLKQLLKGMAAVEVVTDAREGVKKACQKPQPDLIISDVMMPGMDGFEFCSLLKSMPETRDIPVILMTVLDTDQDQVQGLQAGAADYIIKPYNLEVVKARVKRQLELKEDRDLLASQSHADMLTGIYNRRKFEEVLESEWRRAFRKHEWISLLLIDIDFFKDYNDYYGHQAGDTSLRQVACLLTETIRRSGDVVARYGGEEFACLLPGVDPAQLHGMAEKILQAVRNAGIPHKASPKEEILTVSIGGMAMVPKDLKNKKRLVRRADQALYEAKAAGRNRVVLNAACGTSIEGDQHKARCNGV